MAEFALVLPLLALFLVMAVDFGRVFFSYVQITNGAREAAALGGSDLSGPTNLVAMRDRALLEANIQDHGGEDSTIQIASVVCRDAGGATIACASAVSGAGPGNTVTVTVTRDFTFITPLVGSIIGNNFEMSVSATAPVLGYASSGGGGPTGSCSPPIADFNVTVLSGRTIEVDPSASSPQSSGNPCNISGYNWDWGDGSEIQPGSATAAQHTYSSDGTFTVTLEVTNQEGSSTTSNLATVPSGPPVVCTPPVASFTTSTTGNGSNRWFTYSDTSTVADPANCPITSWLWTFHDANPVTQSNAQFPAPFQYSSGGSKSVTLQVTNAGGSHSLTKNTP
jgi:PKD repeat protein